VDGVSPLLASKVFLGFFFGKFTLGQEICYALFCGCVLIFYCHAAVDVDFPESCAVDSVGDFGLGCWDLGQVDISAFPDGRSGAAFKHNNGTVAAADLALVVGIDRGVVNRGGLQPDVSA
jgi:hypothetical protein